VIVAVISEKGGQGKSTFSSLFAIERAKVVEKVLLLDTSHQQGSSHKWMEKRKRAGYTPRADYKHDPDLTFMDELESLYTEYDDIIVDVAGVDSDALRGILVYADVAVVPMLPSMLDLETADNIDTVVEEAQESNQELRAAFVLNRATTNIFKAQETFDAKEYLGAFENCVLSDIVLCDRVAYQKVAITGQSITELESKDKSTKKALKEFNELLEVVFDDGE